MKYYSIGEFANKIGKTVQTLRNWDKNGSLKPHHITEGGTRYYSQEQLNHFLGLKSKTKLNKKTARTLLPTEYGRAGYYQYHGDIIHRVRADYALSIPQSALFQKGAVFFL